MALKPGDTVEGFTYYERFVPRGLSQHLHALVCKLSRGHDVETITVQIDTSGWQVVGPVMVLTQQRCKHCKSRFETGLELTDKSKLEQHIKALEILGDSQTKKLDEIREAWKRGEQFWR